MQTLLKALGGVVLLALAAIVAIAASVPVLSSWSRQQSRRIVEDLTGARVMRACVATNGEGGRWYFAETEALSSEEAAELDARLSRHARRTCPAAERGSGNPTAEDPPSWFDWHPAESQVVMRCDYTEQGLSTGTLRLTDGRFMLVAREHGDARAEWPSDDLVSVHSWFCER